MTQTVKTTMVKTITAVETTATAALPCLRARELTPVIAQHVPQQQTG
jgi:hypothetical protein